MTQVLKAIVVLNDEETWSSLEDSYIHFVTIDDCEEIVENFKQNEKCYLLHHVDFEWSVSLEELLNFYLSHKTLGYTPLKTEDAA